MLEASWLADRLVACWLGWTYLPDHGKVDVMLQILHDIAHNGSHLVITLLLVAYEISM